MRSRPQYHQLRNNNRDQGGKRQSDIIATPRATFKGECPELKGSYLNLSIGYREDMYEASIRLMIGYVTSKYDNGDGIKIIFNELKMPTLDKPEALYSMADDVDKYIYK